MVTITFILRPDRTNKKGECPLNIQFIENGKRKAISMGISIHPSLWNSVKELPDKKHPHYMDIKTLIETRKSEINAILLEHKIKKLPISINELINKIELNKKIIKSNLIEYFDEVINRLMSTDKIGYANVFKETKRQLINYSVTSN